MNSFTFFEEYYELIKYLNEEDRLVLYDAIFKYMFEDEDTEFDGLNKGIWINLKRPLSISKIKGNNGKIKKKSKQNQKEIKTKSKRNQESSLATMSMSLSMSNININNINNKNNIYSLLEEYLDIRNKNKYVVNETVIKRLINKLNQYGTTDEEKALVIENAINGKWKDFYPLKESEKEKVPEWFNKELKNEEMTKEDKEEMDKLLNEIQEI